MSHTQNLADQVNLVKVINPEPSKGSKVHPRRERSPGMNKTTNIAPIDLWGKECKPDLDFLYQENSKRVCIALVYKYRYLLKLGFESFQKARYDYNAHRVTRLESV